MSKRELVTAKYKEIFAKYDANADGVLEKSEMKALFTSIGVDLNAKELKAIIIELDMNKNKVIDFPEFCNLVLLIKEKLNSSDI